MAKILTSKRFVLLGPAVFGALYGLVTSKYPKVMMVPLCSYWPNDNFEHGIPFVKLRGAHGKLGGKEHQI